MEEKKEISTTGWKRERWNAGNVRKPSDIEFKKTVHSDGSCTELIFDKETGRAEISEYDSQGELIERIYGTFRD